MEISANGIALIKQFEGFRSQVYKDTAGNATIGYGHKIEPNESFPNVITLAEADLLLNSDVHVAESWIARLVRVNLNQNQFDALVDFVFNLGPGSLQHSTLLLQLNTGNYKATAAQFPLWDHADGVVVGQLLERRTAEQKLWNTP